MFIYTLRLSEDCWYVGLTMDKEKRLKQHLSGYASAWTKKHPVVGGGYASVEPVPESNNPKLQEDMKVKELMMQYGIDNVRGGSYSQVKLDDSVIEGLKKEIDHANDNCFLCKKSGHFARYCKATHDIEGSPINRSKSKAKANKTSSSKKNAAETLSLVQELLETVDNMLCLRCGRDSHKSSSCYAKTDVNGQELEDDNDESEEESEEEEISCSRCGRPGHEEDQCYAKKTIDGVLLSELDTEEDMWMTQQEFSGRKRALTYVIGQASADNSPKKISKKESGGVVCFRCKRGGHTAPKCYARTDVHGFPL